MELLKRYEFILIVSYLDLISSVNRESQTHGIWLVDWDYVEHDHSLIQLDCTLWPHMLQLIYIVIHSALLISRKSLRLVYSDLV